MTHFIIKTIREMTNIQIVYIKIIITHDQNNIDNKINGYLLTLH